MRSITYILSGFLFVFLLMFSSCSEESNPVDGGEGEHARGIGVVIRSSGQTVVRYERNEAVSGELSGPNGQTSVAYDFYLIDEDGDEYQPGAEHHSLTWELADTTVAGIWQHEGEEGGFEFHVVGKDIGLTSIVFSVLHEGHPDFVSKSIPVRVE